LRGGCQGFQHWAKKRHCARVWISTFIAPAALVPLLWRTIVEDRMPQCDLASYANYAARVRYRLMPRAGISYALTEAMDEGHCGLPTDDLVPLAEKLSRGPSGAGPDGP